MLTAMPKIRYESKRFRAETLRVLDLVGGIVQQYQRQGFTLSLRQLYYQLVTQNVIPNSEREYKRLGDIVRDGRRAGLIDWEAIEDRGRFLRSRSHWSEPSDIVKSAARSFAIDKWATQDVRPEVWVEKDALVGVIEPVCDLLCVPFFACRGYASETALWEAAQRLMVHVEAEQTPVVFHLGDHDPSGIDMTRDIRDRLQLFGAGEIEVRRLALNIDRKSVV